MTPLAQVLEDVRCAYCGAVDTLWLDARRHLVECRDCGLKTSPLAADDPLGVLAPSDSLDVLDPSGLFDVCERW